MKTGATRFFFCALVGDIILIQIVETRYLASYLPYKIDAKYRVSTNKKIDEKYRVSTNKQKRLLFRAAFFTIQNPKS